MGVPNYVFCIDYFDEYSSLANQFCEAKILRVFLFFFFYFFNNLVVQNRHHILLLHYNQDGHHCIVHR